RGSDGYRGSGGGYRGGYDSGHRNGGYQAYGKINEDDVPESQHSIFVRGLPSSITYDEIKNFFEDNIGPCSFDFQKVNYERQSLFVAVRFETKEHAKEAYNKYRDEDILGCRCEVTWFRDIRRYISYQQQTGGVIRRGNFGRGRGYHNNYNRPEYRKRRYSDDRDRRSRSRSYSDSDRSRSRSRRSSKSRSSRDRSATWNSEDEKPRRKRSRSRSEGERSSSRESDRRRSESKDEKRKDKKKEKKVKKAKKERRSRRSESASSRSDGERSRSSSQSERDSPSKKRSKTGRGASPASSTGSPLRMTPPPPAPTIIGPIIPSTTSTPAPEKSEKSAPLRSDDDDFSTRARNGKRQRKKKSKNEEKSRWENDMETVDVDTKDKEHTKIMITIANKSTVPVENTSFKMSLDGDEPPRKIVRGPLTPEKKDDDLMEVEEKEEENVPLRKENIPVDPKEKGGWRTVGDNSGPPSDVIPEALQPPPPAPTLIQPTLTKVNGSPEKTVNGVEMVPRSVTGPPPPSMGTPNPPPPKRPPMGTPSSLPPPPGRPSLGGGAVGGALAARCPEMAKTIREIKTIQDQLISTVKPSQLRLSDLSSGESMLEKMEEREKLIGELDQLQKNKFDIKMKQIANSYRGDAQTITTVIKSVVQKDPSLEDQIKPALMAVLEDLEKQIYKKVDDFLVCGI
ncbi:hypothetical protein PMAYCL1PPCAC_02871, partial [Pristionchus mayeri]